MGVKLQPVSKAPGLSKRSSGAGVKRRDLSASELNAEIQAWMSGSINRGLLTWASGVRFLPAYDDVVRPSDASVTGWRSRPFHKPNIRLRWCSRSAAAARVMQRRGWAVDTKSFTLRTAMHSEVSCLVLQWTGRKKVNGVRPCRVVSCRAMPGHAGPDCVGSGWGRIEVGSCGVEWGGDGRSVMG